MNQPKPSDGICGIDEVGRGPLAGPVTAAAVVLTETVNRALLKDSKVLSEGKRFFVEEHLKSTGVIYALGWVSPAEIDRMNIHNAALLAMRYAWESLLSIYPPLLELNVVVDGRFCPSLPVTCTAVVAADSSVDAVMAASIIAKNARDRRMVLYAREYPGYGLDRHKGYPTALHREALNRLGASAIHRRTFRGVPAAVAPDDGWRSPDVPENR